MKWSLSFSQPDSEPHLEPWRPSLLPDMRLVGRSHHLLWGCAVSRLTKHADKVHISSSSSSSNVNTEAWRSHSLRSNITARRKYFTRYFKTFTELHSHTHGLQLGFIQCFPVNVCMGVWLVMRFNISPCRAGQKKCAYNSSRERVGPQRSEDRTKHCTLTCGERAGTHSSVLMLPCWEDHFLLTVRTNNVIDKQHGTGIKLSPCVVNQSVSQAQNCPKCEDPRLTPCVARTCYLSPHNVQCWLFIIVLPVDRPGTGGGYHTGLVASNILYTQHTSLPCLHPACTECIRSIGKTSAPTNRIRRRLRLADWPGLHLGRTNERPCYIVWSRVDGWHVTRYPGCWRPHLGIRTRHNTQHYLTLSGYKNTLQTTDTGNDKN